MEQNVESPTIHGTSNADMKDSFPEPNIRTSDPSGKQSNEFYDLKISMFGPSQSSKSSVVKLLKGENKSAVYKETWCVQVNVIEWSFSESCQTSGVKEERKAHAITEETKEHFPERTGGESVFRLAIWESGYQFLKKFPFYTTSLLKNAHIIIYTHAFHMLGELSQLDTLFAKARAEWSKSSTKAFVTRGGQKLPIEVLFVTHSDKRLLSALDEDEIEEHALQAGIKSVRFVSVPVIDLGEEEAEREEKTAEENQDLYLLQKHRLSSVLLDDVCLTYIKNYI